MSDQGILSMDQGRPQNYSRRGPPTMIVPKPEGIINLEWQLPIREHDRGVKTRIEALGIPAMPSSYVRAVR